MNYYTVGKPTTTHYEAPCMSIVVWKELDIIKLWKKLKELGITTWAQLYGAKFITVYYEVEK